MFWTYEDELKFQRMEAYEEGEKRGRKQGEKKGKMENLKQIINKMLQKQVDIEFIMEVTGLSRNEIEKYQKN